MTLIYDQHLPLLSLSLSLSLFTVPPKFFSLFSPQISMYYSREVCCPFPPSHSLSLFPQRFHSVPMCSTCQSVGLLHFILFLLLSAISLSLTAITFVLSKFQLLCRTVVSSQQLCWIKWDTFKLYLLLGIRVFYSHLDIQTNYFYLLNGCSKTYRGTQSKQRHFLINKIKPHSSE